MIFFDLIVRFLQHIDNQNIYGVREDSSIITIGLHSLNIIMRQWLTKYDL